MASVMLAFPDVSSWLPQQETFAFCTAKMYTELCLGSCARQVPPPLFMFFFFSFFTCCGFEKNLQTLFKIPSSLFGPAGVAPWRGFKQLKQPGP